MLLRVLGPASGICLAIAIAPEFPEVIYMGPSLNWSWGRGGHIPLGSSLCPLSFCLCVYVYVHAYVGGCVCVDFVCAYVTVCVCLCGCIYVCVHMCI